MCQRASRSLICRLGGIIRPSSRGRSIWQNPVLNRLPFGVSTSVTSALSETRPVSKRASPAPSLSACMLASLLQGLRGRCTLNITDLAASDVGRKIRIVGFGGEFEIHGILERVTYEWNVPHPEQWGSSPEIASVGLTGSGWEATLTPTTTCELLTAMVTDGRTTE